MINLSELLGTTLSGIILLALIGIILQWLFVYSAVKAGTKAALEDIMENRLSSQTKNDE